MEDKSKENKSGLQSPQSSNSKAAIPQNNSEMTRKALESSPGQLLKDDSKNNIMPQGEIGKHMTPAVSLPNMIGTTDKSESKINEFRDLEMEEKLTQTPSERKQINLEDEFDDDPYKKELIKKLLLQNKSLKMINRSEKEIETLEQLAETEMRIYKLYKDYSQKEMIKEKMSTINSIQSISQKNEQAKSEIEELTKENVRLKKLAKLYKEFVDNFDDGYKALVKFKNKRMQAEDGILDDFLSKSLDSDLIIREMQPDESKEI